MFRVLTRGTWNPGIFCFRFKHSCFNLPFESPPTSFEYTVLNLWSAPLAMLLIHRILFSYLSLFPCILYCSMEILDVCCSVMWLVIDLSSDWTFCSRGFHHFHSLILFWQSKVTVGLIEPLNVPQPSARKSLLCTSIIYPSHTHTTGFISLSVSVLNEITQHCCDVTEQACDGVR